MAECDLAAVIKTRKYGTMEGKAFFFLFEKVWMRKTVKEVQIKTFISTKLKFYSRISLESWEAFLRMENETIQKILLSQINISLSKKSIERTYLSQFLKNQFV
jgi:hypothetical protein